MTSGTVAALHKQSPVDKRMRSSVRDELGFRLSHLAVFGKCFTLYVVAKAVNSAQSRRRVVTDVLDLTCARRAVLAKTNTLVWDKKTT